MTTLPCQAQTTTFYQLLDQTPSLDGRDNRGKRHTTVLILIGLVLALCCGRDGKPSSLHHHMVNHFETLCAATQQSHQKPISRAQLPLLLAKVNGVLFAQLLLDWFGLTLDADRKRWFALDGKELRGSIQPSHLRGEVCVLALAHDSQEVVNQAYYNSTKESERPTVHQLLNDGGLYNQKLTVKAIHGAKGVYIIGVKVN